MQDYPHGKQWARKNMGVLRRLTAPTVVIDARRARCRSLLQLAGVLGGDLRSPRAVSRRFYCFRPWRERRVDRQLDSARAVSADFRRRDPRLSGLRLLPCLARAPHDLRGKPDLLPAIPDRTVTVALIAANAPCGGGSPHRLPRPSHLHVTTREKRHD